MLQAKDVGVPWYPAITKAIRLKNSHSYSESQLGHPFSDPVEAELIGLNFAEKADLAGIAPSTDEKFDLLIGALENVTVEFSDVIQENELFSQSIYNHLSMAPKYTYSDVYTSACFIHNFHGSLSQGDSEVAVNQGLAVTNDFLSIYTNV